MSTYKELQDRIALDYLNNMALIGEVKRAINNAIKTYEARRYWFNEASTAVATVANQTYVSVPTDFMQLDRLEITANGSVEQLWPTTFDAIREMNMNSTATQPTHFAYRGDAFELAAVPDSAYTVNVYYLKTLPALSADTDTNAWTNEAQNLIAHAATLDLLMGVLQTANQSMIDRHVSLLQAAENELSLRNAARLLGHIQSTTF